MFFIQLQNTNNIQSREAVWCWNFNQISATNTHAHGRELVEGVLLLTLSQLLLQSLMLHKRPGVSLRITMIVTISCFKEYIHVIMKTQTVRADLIG